MPVASLLGSHPAFSYFPCFPQVDCVLSDADSLVGGVIYILGPHGPFQQTLLRDRVSPASQPPQVYIARGFEALFLHGGILGCVVYLAPLCSSWLIYIQMRDIPICQPLLHLPQSAASCHLAAHLCSGFPSPPLLPFWMNVYSLTPCCWTSMQFDFLADVVVFCF